MTWSLSISRPPAPRDSKAQIELVRHVSVERLRRLLGNLPPDLMQEVDDRLLEHLGL